VNWLLAFITFGLAILTFTTCELAISWLSPLVDPALITNFKYFMHCKWVGGLVLVWFWIVEILNLVINSLPCHFYSTFPSTFYLFIHTFVSLLQWSLAGHTSHFTPSAYSAISKPDCSAEYTRLCAPGTCKNWQT